MRLYIDRWIGPPVFPPTRLAQLLIAVFWCASSWTLEAAFQPAGHPFILWTKDEAAAIRRRVETEPWAKAKYEEMLADKGLGKTYRNLFRYQVMGDDSVLEPEKKYLLGLVGKDPRNFKGDTGGGRHYDQCLDVLRYDVLYDRLTPDERKALEDTFRVFINHHLHEETLTFTRTSWLPNMQWPRPITAHLMAAALQDETIIRQVFNSKGGWKFYFDDYLTDGQFYCEEFGKQYSMIGEMFLWCRAVERLGLDDLGYGYTGKGGATMRRYLESVVNIGYPRVDLPGGRPHYPQLTMGDARGSSLVGAPPYVFQKSIVDGYLPNGEGGNRFWIAANMNGRDHKNTKVDKMLHPLWFELAHVKWPEARFDYFLAQMRPPGAERYVPTLFWGASPVDPSQVKPPPARGYVARERGFAFLRAEESERYWESEAPAVGFQLTTYYVHYTHDCFSLLGYHAFNRPIYLNRQISNGYGGGCPWTDSARGHCGVLVDKLQWALNDANPAKDHPHWPNPIGEVPTRHRFDPLVKFVAAQGRPAGGKVNPDSQQPLGVGTLSVTDRREEPEIYPGVDLERALFLTREYLFDVFRLQSEQPHLYEWHVHALGNLALPQTDKSAWQPTDELQDRLYDLANRQVAKRLEDPVERNRYQMKDVFKLEAQNQPWQADVRQDCALPDPAASVLGPQWYSRKIGVRVRMLGDSGTVVYAGKSPESRRVGGKEKNKGEKSEMENEIGGTTLVVARTKPGTVFAVLHEPYKEGQPKIAAFRQIQQNDRAVGVAISGLAGKFEDRILYSFWGDHSRPLTVEGDGESFTFTDHVFIRATPDAVEVIGNLARMKMKVAGRPALKVNGKLARTDFDGGLIIYGE